MYVILGRSSDLFVVAPRDSSEILNTTVTANPPRISRFDI
jgi:hypothetical protein